MKKILALLITVILSLGILTACGKSAPDAALGLGTAVSYSDGEAAEAAVSATVVTVAAVILEDGRIRSIAVTSFSDGYAVSDRGVYSDREVTEYAYSTDGLVGRSESEIRGIAMDENLRKAILSAIADAKSEGAAGCTGTDQVGIAIMGKGSGTNADFYIEDGMNGKASTDATYAAVALDASGKVSAAALDAIQISRTFGASGTLTEPKPTLTKRELGYDYGMKGVSASYGIGLEWFEQASGFCTYLLGKTKDEIGSIGISNQGKPTDAALLSYCTIAIGDFVAVARAAAEDAT